MNEKVTKADIIWGISTFVFSMIPLILWFVFGGD